MAKSWPTLQAANLILAIYIVNAVKRHDAKFLKKSETVCPTRSVAQTMGHSKGLNTKKKFPYAHRSLLLGG